MGDLGPFTSGGPTTALVDDALLGDAVTEDRRSCSSCGPNKARNKCFSTERQTDMCVAIATKNNLVLAANGLCLAFVACVSLGSHRKQRTRQSCCLLAFSVKKS